jgi:Fur family ferric uptake transcriptional regulator/Fur family peroxide stress response transcriptional regulator
MSDTTTIDRELSERLRARGQRVTSQRLVINRALRERDRHVTAEELLHAVTPTLPSTSLPTVYATLELFEQLGIVRRLNAGTGAVLFDSRSAEHQHVVCRRCGAVADLDVALDTAAALDAARTAGFAPARAALVVDALCEDCAAGTEDPSPAS